ncbi:hypothetical protein D3877_26135 [Azospirillum cavernae]|uniref:Motility protein n=1 Tax=Azospirillum cavernae TaxID=2320860 RepID=A0A418VM79_9PROT|nr:hypothetical protein [Azospirillum cavernae]RJF77293.1 hypothetical protein D3877_26135 [Azospirillum cavernae]
MAFDVTSSTAGAAVSLRQAQGQYDFGVKTLSQDNQQQAAAVATLLQGGSNGGGNVTPTRGQNLNISV